MFMGMMISIKSYIGASYIVFKPLMTYVCVKLIWISGLGTSEWLAGRLYSINCIGEGMSGFYNHIWSIASPSCTGLLTTHIGLMGVLVASFIITFLWGIYSMANQIKTTNVSRQVVHEFTNLKSMASGVPK